MSDRHILVVATRDTIPHARDLVSLINAEGWHGTTVLAHEEMPIEAHLPAAVVIWAPPLVAYSVFKTCCSCFPRKLTQFVVVLPSGEQPTVVTDPDHPNEVYLKGVPSTKVIMERLKTSLEKRGGVVGREAATAKPVARQRQARIITVFSAKGGVGKTAISTNLAVAIKLAKRNDVLLIDGDLQFGDIAVWLGLSPRVGITELLARGSAIDELAIKSTVQEHESGVEVLLPPTHPATAERIRPEAVKAMVSVLRGLYDYIVIDTHTSYADETLAMLDVSDDILLVVTPEISVIRNTQVFLELCDVLGYADRVQVVLNRANTGVKLTQLPPDIRKLVKGEVVSDGRAVVWSLNAGKPFVLADRTLPVSKSIVALGNLLVGPPDGGSKNGAHHRWWPFGGGRASQKEVSVAATPQDRGK